MVQVSERVGSAQNGSMNAVSGSGMASMSEASMLFQPRMLEPSKPKPSAKTSSVSSPMGQEKCCQVPKVSTNFTSTILAPFFLAISITCLGVLMFLGFRYGFSFVSFLLGLCPVKLQARRCAKPAAAGRVEFVLAVVALFAVLGEVEADGFDFLARTQADDGLDDV